MGIWKRARVNKLHKYLLSIQINFRNQQQKIKKKITEKLHHQLKHINQMQAATIVLCHFVQKN